MRKQDVGRFGEAAAAEWLVEQGYQLLEQNFRCKVGEIDIVALHSGVVVFVEVKTRRSVVCGFPAEAVTWRKRRKILQSAQWYLQQQARLEQACRFDVIEVQMINQRVVINHIVHAFGHS